MKIKICNCIDNNPIREFDIDQSNLTILELLEHSLQRLNLQNLILQNNGFQVFKHH